MENRKTKIDELREGNIITSYGGQNFLTVSPVPDICSCKFSIVEKGSAGKKHTDFYLDMDKMRRLVEEINDGPAYKKLQDDAKNQYPSAYKYTTGENGCKHLNIGGGMKGIRVQVSDTSAKVNQMVVVPWTDIQDMAFYFNLVMGEKVTSRYYSKLADAFWEGVIERQKYFKKQ